MLSLLSLGSGCILPGLDIDNKACPCAAGWTCDERLDQCVLGQTKDLSDAGTRSEGGPSIEMEGGIVDRLDGSSPLGTTNRDASPAGANDAGPIMPEDAGPIDITCDGGPMPTWWRDGDVDGFGDRAQAVRACTQPLGHAANDDDCDDSKGTIYPGAAELCDTLDNDCNAGTDDACPAQCTPRISGGRLYWLCDKLLNWGDASLACAGGGLVLVRIDSSAENDFVRARASELLAQDVWLGGSDSAEPSVWRWSDGDVFWRGSGSGSPENGAYEKWGADEPSEGAGENCAEMRAGSMWNDVSCAQLRKFICERY